VVAARSKTKVLRRVVRQLPVKILQQCSSASSCMWTHIVMKERYTVCQHSTFFVLNGTKQCFEIQNAAELTGDRLLDTGKCLNSDGDYVEK
jgi:hypothetical protein